MLALFKKKKKEKLPARIRGNSCLNCDISLDGDENFCPDCGQRNNTNPLSFKLVVDEFFGDMFTYDSRLWRTIVPLVIKPGKIAYQFISGKRKDFVNPFRTYLTISLIFFLIYGLLNQINELKDDGSNNLRANIVNFNNNSQKDTLSTKQKDSITQAVLNKVQKEIPIDLDSTLKAGNLDINLGDIKAENISADSLKNLAKEKNKFFDKLSTFYEYYEKNEDHSVAQALDSLGYENTFWNRFYYDKAKDSKIMMEDRGESFNKKIFSGLSIAIFLLLPVFAWFLRLLYIRRKYTYMEHLVFVFYAQSVFFLLLLLFIIINFFAKDETGSIVFISLLLFSIYLLLAMRAFYKQGWFKTVIKFLMANFTFMFIAMFGLSILTVVSFIFY